MLKSSLEFEKPIVELYNKIEELKALSAEDEKNEMAEDIEKLKAKAAKLRERIYANLEPFQIVQIARHPDRPSSLEYISNIFSDFMELHGDRLYGDDKALIGGFAKFENEPVMVIGQQRGHNSKVKWIVLHLRIWGLRRFFV
ncbi:MAG: hypothetical protein H7836_17520 [Magnetococcus sp. YQC-3]